MIYRIADRVSIIDMREAHIRAVMDILAASYAGPSLWTESQLRVAWSGHNTLIKVARFDGLTAGVIVMRAFRNGVETGQTRQDAVSGAVDAAMQTGEAERVDTRTRSMKTQ